MGAGAAATSADVKRRARRVGMRMLKLGLLGSVEMERNGE